MASAVGIITYKLFNNWAFVRIVGPPLLHYKWSENIRSRPRAISFLLTRLFFFKNQME